MRVKQRERGDMFRKKVRPYAGQKGLSKVEKSFLYQMSDILTISGGSTDSGGESLQMKVLTEEEANQADAEEWNSIRAYGASDEDMVTFLQVPFWPQLTLQD